jgi:tol-pal system protein YbgF
LSHRILLLLVLAALPAWPVDREIIQLQRDMALLQDQVRTLQRSNDEKFAALQQLLTQNMEASKGLTASLAAIEKTVQGQEKVLAAPVANVSARVDTLATQFQALKESVDEVNGRLVKMQAQISDIKNLVSTVPPPSAPAASPAAPQMSADTLYRNAMRDFQAANYDLAGPEFNEYIRLYGSTDQAAEAQYYLGEIFFQQKQYTEALGAYDQVLERYQEGRMTASAQYKKGMSLLQLGKRTEAMREFRDVTRKYPNSPAAIQAAAELRKMGPVPGGAAKGKTTKR